jgi:hypothetical protein
MPPKAVQAILCTNCGNLHAAWKKVCDTPGCRAPNPLLLGAKGGAAPHGPQTHAVLRGDGLQAMAGSGTRAWSGAPEPWPYKLARQRAAPPWRGGAGRPVPPGAAADDDGFAPVSNKKQKRAAHRQAKQLAEQLGLVLSKPPTSGAEAAGPGGKWPTPLQATGGATSAPGSADGPPLSTGLGGTATPTAELAKRLQQAQAALDYLQGMPADMQGICLPDGLYQSKVEALKLELQQLHAQKRGLLPAAQQLKQAQDFADRLAKRLDVCVLKQKQQQEALQLLQQQMQDTDAEAAKLAADSAAAAEQVRQVSLRAAAAATVATAPPAQGQSAALALVVSSDEVAADPKLREALEYLNQHRALASAVLSLDGPAALAGAEARAQERDHLAEQAELLRQACEQMDEDLASDVESEAPTVGEATSGAAAATAKRQKKREDHKLRATKTRKLLSAAMAVRPTIAKRE